MTSALVERSKDRIARVLSCFDRVVAAGRLSAIRYADLDFPHAARLE
jgi:hypothetical protein